MKTLLLIILIFVNLNASADDSLVIYLSFDEGVFENQVLDRSGNENHGTLFPTNKILGYYHNENGFLKAKWGFIYPTLALSRFGKAIYLDGEEQHIIVEGNKNFDYKNGFSFMLWFWLDKDIEHEVDLKSSYGISRIIQG